MQRRHANQRRSGFTLVEMLVAMTVTLFIMVIITTAYTTGLDTFRGLKGIGDMQESLRTAAQRLRDDLRQNHFDGSKRLSDPFLWNVTRSPRHGFFRIHQASPGTFEGVDLDGLPSYRAPRRVNNRHLQHILHFSVNMRGNRADDFYVADVPINSPFDPFSKGYKPTAFFDQPDTRWQERGTYTSQWAEVAYFLQRTGSTFAIDDPNNNAGAPLYSLYRVQRVVVPDNSKINNLIPASEWDRYAELSCQPDPNGKLYFNTPTDLAKPDTFLANKPPIVTRGFQFDPQYPPTGQQWNNKRRFHGASLLMTHVVSFRVQILKRFSNGRLATTWTNVGTRFPATFDTYAPFDNTRHPTTGARQYTIAAIKVEMRVFDEASVQTRQVSLIKDM